MTNEKLEQIAVDAKANGQNDLAIALYTYMGADKLGMGSDFARYCQEFARAGIKQVEMNQARRNN